MHKARDCLVTLSGLFHVSPISGFAGASAELFGCSSSIDSPVSEDVSRTSRMSPVIAMCHVTCPELRGIPSCGIASGLHPQAEDLSQRTARDARLASDDTATGPHKIRRGRGPAERV